MLHTYMPCKMQIGNMIRLETGEISFNYVM